MTLAKSLQAAAGNSMLPNYIEGAFSTYLYTGNGSTQTITNDIDLAGEGGMVWIKDRTAAVSNILGNTVSGVPNHLISNATSANQSWPGYGITAYNSNGFSVADDGGAYGVNGSSSNYASWTFRKQPKFFDVVTWTGDGTTPRNISHSLGSVPGCIIIKRTDDTGNWIVYHRSLNGGVDPQQYLLFLNSTLAQISDTGSTTLANTVPTSTQFTVGTSSNVNASGGTYVAYLFAHDAGGFGESGTDNVVSCGSVTIDGSGQGNVNLGYEPQWILYKRTDGAGNWSLVDSMRGWNASPNQSGATLFANDSFYEDQLGGQGSPPSFPNSTGFNISGSSGQAFIYIAIRRGPMKVPTDGTKVFAGDYRTGGFTSGFPVDLAFIKNLYTPDDSDWKVGSRLTGTGRLATTSTAAEVSDASLVFDSMTGFYNSPAADLQSWMFRRAPGFFDEVCYTGTGSARTVAHNLGIAPELMLVKWRSGTAASWSWNVYAAPLSATKFLYLNLSNAEVTSSAAWNDTQPTASVFTLGSGVGVNESARTYVAYLFASCPGVSKVGSYTGNGTTQTIPCGFAAGARFVMIKRTDSSGDWYVWDSARGIVAGNDPHLSLNSTAAEVTTDDSVDVDSTGFIVNQLAATNINVTSASYIFLAIA